MNAPNDGRTVVHIGYWKTATTTLQSRVFPHVQDCTFLARSRSGTGPIVGALAGNLCHATDDEFLEGTFRVFLDEVATPGRPMLLSHEAFAGAPFEAMYNRERNADRLHRVVAGASILVVVRHQGTMLRSLYNYYVQRGGYGSLAAFLDGRAPGSDFRLDALWYDRSVETYQQRFGAGAVKVVPYEMLVAAPAQFLGEVIGFVGAPVPSEERLSHVANRGLSRPSRLLLRGTNRLFRASRFNAHPLLGPLVGDGPVNALQRRVDTHLVPETARGFNAADDALIESVLPSFAPSNQRLESLCGPVVGHYGYPGTSALAAAAPTVESA